MSNLLNCLVIIAILFSFASSQLLENEDETAFMDERDALSYAEQSPHSFDKRWLYTGKEQRREAKENYEEKCERKLLSAAMAKPRWCPELETWPQWNQWRAKDGVIYSQLANNNGPRRPGQYPSNGPQRPYPNNPNRPNNNNPYNNDNFNRVPYNPNNPTGPYDNNNNNQYPGNNRDPYNQRRPQQPNQNYPFKQ